MRNLYIGWHIQYRNIGGIRHGRVLGLTRHKSRHLGVDCENARTFERGVIQLLVFIKPALLATNLFLLSRPKQVVKQMGD
jgi:hypothetical protein